MTASDLHHLFASTTDGGDEYDAGRDGWRVTSKHGDVHLTVTTQEQAGCSTTVRDLDPDDLDDLILALMRARAARETYLAGELAELDWRNG